MGHVTVFSGPERRRRWTDAERLQVLTEAFSSEGCVAQVARRHDVSTSLIYTWRRKLCQPVEGSGSATPGEIGFTEAVVVVDDAGAALPTVQPAIVVDLAQNGQVSIFASASPAVAAAVLKALVR